MKIKRLFQKTLFGVIGMFGLIGVSTSGLAIYTVDGHLSREYVSNSRNIAKTIADSSVDILLNRDLATLQSLIDQFLGIQGTSPVQTLSHSGGKEGRWWKKEEQEKGRKVMQVTTLLRKQGSPWTPVPQQLVVSGSQYHGPFGRRSSGSRSGTSLTLHTAPPPAKRKHLQQYWIYLYMCVHLSGTRHLLLWFTTCVVITKCLF